MYRYCELEESKKVLTLLLRWWAYILNANCLTLLVKWFSLHTKNVLETFLRLPSHPAPSSLKINMQHAQYQVYTRIDPYPRTRTHLKIGNVELVSWLGLMFLVEGS